MKLRGWQGKREEIQLLIYTSKLSNVNYMVIKLCIYKTILVFEIGFSVTIKTKKSNPFENPNTQQATTSFQALIKNLKHASYNNLQVHAMKCYLKPYGIRGQRLRFMESRGQT